MITTCCMFGFCSFNKDFNSSEVTEYFELINGWDLCNWRSWLKGRLQEFFPDFVFKTMSLFAKVPCVKLHYQHIFCSKCFPTRWFMLMHVPNFYDANNVRFSNMRCSLRPYQYVCRLNFSPAFLWAEPAALHWFLWRLLQRNHKILFVCIKQVRSFSAGVGIASFSAESTFRQCIIRRQ